jgi:hypothetical protein
LTRAEAEAIARKLIANAVQGDVSSARLLLERLNGPVTLRTFGVAIGEYEAREGFKPFVICVTEEELP